MSESTPPSNRRASIRRKPKTSTKVTCVTGKMGFGPNVAISLLDVSETGIRLIIKTPVQPGHEVEIGLEGLADRRTTKLPAQVIWCAALADGSHCLGARFAKPLDYGLLQALATI